MELNVESFCSSIVIADNPSTLFQILGNIFSLEQRMNVDADRFFCGDRLTIYYLIYDDNARTLNVGRRCCRQCCCRSCGWQCRTAHYWCCCHSRSLLWIKLEAVCTCGHGTLYLKISGSSPSDNENHNYNFLILTIKTFPFLRKV